MAFFGTKTSNAASFDFSAPRNVYFSETNVYSAQGPFSEICPVHSLPRKSAAVPR
jgi:hypothetical protein